MRGSRRFSIWLVPSRETRDALAAVMSLGASHGCGTPFAAHVTLCSGADRPAERLERELVRIAAGVPRIAMRARGVRSGPAFFMSVWLGVGPSAELARMRGRVRRRCAGPVAAPARPHVSIAYGVSPRARAHLAARIAEAGFPETLVFDALAFVRPAPGGRGWRDVAAWRVLSTVPLTTPED